VILPDLSWSPWCPLSACWADAGLGAPGLYRVRRAGRGDIDYIGQTGLRLRNRLAMLRGVYGSEMPYRDPHTVAPALWAQRQLTSEDYEASTYPVVGDARWRKALECVAIALYRQEHRCAPTFNFGRMPAGYRMSSPNNARLAAAGRRFRGGPSEANDSSHLSSLCPMGLLEADACGEGWCGHEWSPWGPLTSRIVGPVGSTGIYRIRGGERRIVYIGQGIIEARVTAHQRSVSGAQSPQGKALAASQPLTHSWVINSSWEDHQRLELENDLIAAWVLNTGTPPAAQFYSLRSAQ